MSHTFAPFRELGEIDAVTSATTNVAPAERVGSALLGAGLVGYGLFRRNVSGILLGILGGFLVYRGASGHCECYRRLEIDTAGGHDGHGVPGDAGIKIKSQIEVRRAPMELYHFWRQLENLPGIMPHLESVTMDGSRSHWIAIGPAGHRVEWDAEFINDQPGEMIAWQSLPGSEVQSAGSVHFESVGNGESTRITVKLQYLPPGGKAGHWVARLFRAAPNQQLESDLARFKEKMEAA